MEENVLYFGMLRRFFHRDKKLLKKKKFPLVDCYMRTYFNLFVVAHLYRIIRKVLYVHSRSLYGIFSLSNLD